MRAITREAIEAFNNNKPFKKSNTEVTVYNEKTYYWLHGNCIATKENGVLKITNCGWATNTTKERLKGLKGVSISQRNFKWFLNGKEWNGSLTAV